MIRRWIALEGGQTTLVPDPLPSKGEEGGNNLNFRRLRITMVTVEPFYGNFTSGSDLSRLYKAYRRNWYV